MGFSAMAIFANLARTDRRTQKVIIGHSRRVKLSIGRCFYGSCNHNTLNKPDAPSTGNERFQT